LSNEAKSDYGHLSAPPEQPFIKDKLDSLINSFKIESCITRDLVPSRSLEIMASDMSMFNTVITDNHEHVVNTKVNVERTRELEALLKQVEDSEKMAWNWLESLDVENSQRIQDLHDYIASVELNKNTTSEAIAELLQIECHLREQLNQQKSLQCGYTLSVGHIESSVASEDVNLCDVSASLQQIVGRLHMNTANIGQRKLSEGVHESVNALNIVEQINFSNNSNFQANTSTNLDSESKFMHSDGSACAIDYEACGKMLKSSSQVNLGSYCQGKTKVASGSEELHKLKSAIDDSVNCASLIVEPLRDSHSEMRSIRQYTNGKEIVNPSIEEVSQLKSRIVLLENREKQLKLEIKLLKERQQAEPDNMDAKLIMPVDLHCNPNQEDSEERGPKCMVKQDTDDRHRSETQVSFLENAEREIKIKLEEKEHTVLSYMEQLSSWEQTKQKMTDQIAFLTKSNESLMDDIDDTNIRMSEELARCREAKAVIGAKCVQLEAECDSLRESLNEMITKNVQLEKVIERASEHKSESQRLQHHLEVLLATEEKLLDKLSDKDETNKALLAELTEYKKNLALSDQKLEQTNNALSSYNTLEQRYREELENVRQSLRNAEDSEKTLLVTVSQLEMSETVLNAKLASLEAEKLQAISTDATLQLRLNECQRKEKELCEKIMHLEKSESALQAKISNSEMCTASLIETLKTAQQISLQTQFHRIIESSDSFTDNPDLNLLKETASKRDLDDISTDQQYELQHKHSLYHMERMPRVELLSKICQLERKSALQQNKIRELDMQLQHCHQKIQAATTHSEQSMMPAWLSFVENKVHQFCIWL